MTGTAERAAAVVAAVVANPRRSLLACDVDGTLAPIVARPQDARLAPGARAALAGLADRLGTVALVSGRAAPDVVSLAGLDDGCGLVVLGHYGLQRWEAGRLTSPEPAPGVAMARDRLPALLADGPDGVSLEDKVHSLVVHTRPAADPQEALEALRPALTELAAATGLEAVPGKLVLELRPPGVDKGTALRELVTERRADVVVYAGDDLGDLPAYSALAALQAEGLRTLAIASAPEGDPDSPPELRARADLVLDGPVAVVGWLAALLAQLV